MDRTLWLVLIVFTLQGSLRCNSNQQNHCMVSEDKDDLPYILERCDGAVGGGLVPDGGSCQVRCRAGGEERSLLCVDTKWRLEPGACPGPDREVQEGLNRPKRFIGFIIGAIIGLFVGRSGPPPDRTPPSVTCPHDISKLSDAYQTNTVVYWNDGDASAVDDRDGTVTVWRASRKQSGYIFSEGVTEIIYNARDGAGNMGRCTMKVTVTTIRCSPGPSPTFRHGYYVCHPSDDFVYGTTCNYGCYYGYKIRGSKRRQCQKTGQWTTPSEPVCEKVTCPPLFPAPHSSFTCTDQYNFKSACSYICNTGYDIAPGRSRVRVCAADGQWRGPIPECIDSEPPRITDCPHVLTYFTLRGSAMAKVDWSIPRVTDNSGENIVPKQTSGTINTQPSYHTAGVYDIVYTAEDSTGNKAKDCKFKVIVKELKCFARYPLPRMRIDCPNGYRHGSTCNISCDTNYVLKGNEKFTCEKSETDIPYPIWEPSAFPTCEALSSCPVLSPPKKGALACDLWENGDFCQMQCMKGTDRPPGFTETMFVCYDTGHWKGVNGDLPPCTETRSTTFTVMEAHFYFEGYCTDSTSQEKIKENFLKAFKSSSFHTVGDSRVTVENVKVTCGSVTRKRSTTEIVVDAQIVIDIEKSLDEESFAEAQKKMMELSILMDQDTKQTGASTLFPDLDESTRKSAIIEKSAVQPKCPSGLFPAKSSYSCVGCGEGRYYMSDTDGCIDCPIGTYQDLPDSKACKQCPSGTSTLTTKSLTIDNCLKQCRSGYFSSTGIEPCTPCDQGQYTADIGSSSCQICPGSKSTVGQGAESIQDCKHFDIALVSDPNNTAVLEMTSQTMITAEFTVLFWMMTSHPGTVLSLTSDDTGVLGVQIEDDWSLQIQFNGYTAILEKTTEGDWYQVGVTYVKNTFSASLFGHTSDSAEVVFSSPSDSSLSVVFGGNGFEGSVSQLNIWKNATSPQAACFREDSGDILAWRDVLAGNMTEQVFVQMPSECDDTDECQSSPCVHGTCTDKLGGYSCSCDEGFHGENCDVNTDDCQNNLCANNGTCMDGVSGYTCICSPAYTGEYCDAHLVHGGWGQWGNWTECSTTCGPGHKRRQRRCDNPIPQNGGNACAGSSNQTGTCDVMECPTCDVLEPPPHAVLKCTDEAGMRRCTLECEEGYDLDRAPLSVYECGIETGYEWNFETDDNPHKRLPSCLETLDADEYSVTYQNEYLDVTCSPDSGGTEKLKMQERVQTIVDDLECIRDKTCEKKSVEIEDCESSNAARRKRSITNIGFTVTIGSKPQKGGVQPALGGLSSAVLHLNSSAGSGTFTVTVHGSQYVVSGSPSFSASARCAVGTTRVGYYCVPCGPGTFYINGYCELCDLGRYNNKTMMTFCTACPQRMTTRGRGALSEEECFVYENAPPGGTSIVVIVLIPLLFGLLILLMGVALYVRWRSYRAKIRPSRDENGAAGKSFELQYRLSQQWAKRVIYPNLDNNDLVYPKSLPPLYFGMDYNNKLDVKS